MAPSENTTAGRTSTGFVCPECGREFKTPAALGAHRSRMHGVAGTSRAAASSASTRRRGRSTSAGRAQTSGGSSRATATRARSGGARSAGHSRATAPLDRDALLRALFPGGVPAKAEVLAALAPWLEEGERLARMR